MKKVYSPVVMFEDFLKNNMPEVVEIERNEIAEHGMTWCFNSQGKTKAEMASERLLCDEDWLTYEDEFVPLSEAQYVAYLETLAQRIKLSKN